MYVYLVMLVFLVINRGLNCLARKTKQEPCEYLIKTLIRQVAGAVVSVQEQQVAKVPYWSAEAMGVSNI